MNPALIISTKRFLWTYCRPVFQVVRKYRKAQHERHDQWKSVQVREILKLFMERYGLVIQDGPFRGMRYLSDSTGSAIIPKLVGSYEAEVHPWIESYCTPDRPIRVVDIGCDEGFYAVGMAMRMPSARIYAFDISEQARQLCSEMARKNGVENQVIVEGECTPQRLEELLRPGDLLICDCEGCEFTVLDPALAPSLKKAVLLVELHDSDFLELNITPTLQKRFQDSHEIEILTAAHRRPEDWKAVAFLDSVKKAVAIDEGRTLGQQWAFLRPRSK